MPAFVALLRAVNVGGRGMLAMSDLRATAARVGLQGARTLLQSGNLLFEAEDREPSALERDIEAALASDLGLETAAIVRTAGQWSALVGSCPFPALARDEPSRLVAMPLRRAPPAAAVEALAVGGGREAIVLRDATLFVAYNDGIGRSKLTAAVIERRLGTMGTGRNWSTVLKIAAALAT